jgi:hypothetical protein
MPSGAAIQIRELGKGSSTLVAAEQDFGRAMGDGSLTDIGQRLSSMIPKSGNRFRKKIMLKQSMQTGSYALRLMTNVKILEKN